MSDRAHDEEGRFVETVAPEDVLAVLRTAEDPVVTAGEVADELGCTPEAVRTKLERLQEQGRVDRRQVGARAVVWWLVERPPLGADGEHDPGAPFFSAPPLDVDEAESIDVADTDGLLGEVLAEGENEE